MAFQIMYSSKAAEPMSARELQVILDDARKGNEARGITGVLVFADGVFMQILEGEEGVIRELLASIVSDGRHEGLKVFHEGPVAERSFARWSMAYLAPSAEEMAAWAGLEGTASIEAVLEHVHDEAHRVPRILVSIVEALAA